MAGLGNDIDLPFEAGEYGHVDVTAEGGQIAGGVIVMAATAPVPGIGPTPTLVFRFTTPTGGLYPPIALVLNEDQMKKLRPLLNEAIHLSIERARQESGR